MGQLGGRRKRDDVAAAQNIMYEAWEAATHQQRVALARKALAVSPRCADAYVLLAQETARTVDEALDLYRQGVEAGERALGKATFKKDAEHFWGVLETRPYMRARHGLAQALWAKGRRDETVDHYRDMLRLNPNDNQGLRYPLLNCLLELGRDADAAEILQQYKDDGTAAWAYSEALLSFRREGDAKASRAALDRAVKTNAHVPAYLCGRKKLPRVLPALIGIGDEDEAVAYVHDAKAAWAVAPGAAAWLDAAAADRLASASERPSVKKG
ncbi:MAG: tetratricopeptide repeat protein [Rhodospirillales bacterium]|nr:tetratricopeptide repeat protein [Rhodospirillales bacterium]